jgi:hypothetical protein
MSESKKQDALRLTIVNSESHEVLLAQYLRSSSQGVKVSGFQAIKGFFHSIAVSECTQSTKAQRDAALHQCLSLLKHQMTHIMDYHYRLDGTVVAPGSLSTVVVNGVDLQSTPLTVTTGSIAPSLACIPQSPAVEIAQEIESISAIPALEIKIDVENRSDES